MRLNLMKLYQVVGDLTADKSSEAYPVMTLCDECVKNYEVIAVEDSLEKNPCEDCGCYEEENN